MPATESIEVGSAAAAIRPVIDYLLERRVLADRNSTVLVSPAHPVPLLQAIRKRCAITVDPDASVRVVVAWHHLGIPQDLPALAAACAARSVTLIEDCSELPMREAAPSSGSAGIACLFDGALVCRDPALAARAREARECGRSRWVEVLHGLLVPTEPGDEAPGVLRQMIEGVADRAYRARRAPTDEARWALRRQRYAMLVRRCGTSPALVCPAVEGLAPRAVPFVGRGERSTAFERGLAELGAAPRRVLFDVRRMALAPDHRSAVLVPLDGADRAFDAVCRLVERHGC